MDRVVTDRARARGWCAGGAALLFTLTAATAEALCPVPTLWSTWYVSPAGFGGEAHDIAVAPGGDIVVVGYEARYDLNQSWNWHVRRFAADGTFITSWDYTSAGSNIDLPNAVAVGSGGDVVVAGSEAVAGQGYDWRVRAYDPVGALLWSRSLWSFGSDSAEDVAIDSAGNAHVVGYAGLTSQWSLITYAPDGTVIWSRTAAGPGMARAVAVDTAGNTVVAGNTNVAGQGLNWLVRKYDAAGSVIWSVSWNSPANSSDDALGVAIGPGGEIAVVGSEYRFDIQEYMNWRIRVYDANGILQWTATWNGSADSTDVARDVVWRPDGILLVAGDSQDPGPVWIVRGYAAGGSLVLEHRFGDGAAMWSAELHGLAADPAGRAYLAGAVDSVWHVRALDAATPGVCLSTLLQALPDPWASVGATVTVIVTTRNGGLADATGVVPDLGWSPGVTFTPLTGPVPAGALTIPAGGSVSHTWTLTAAVTGWAVFSVTVTGLDAAAAPVSASASRPYGVTAVWPVPPGPADSLGTEFWLAFPTMAAWSPGELFTSVIIGSPVATEGAVSVPALGLVYPFTVAAGATATIYLPTDFPVPDNGIVSDLGVHVVAAADVSVYGMLQEAATTDAYLALPVDVLGHDHLVLAYGPAFSTPGPQSEFGFVATQDDTTVTITPSVEAAGHPAGVPFTIMLDQGQTYALWPTADPGGDLSGSAVLSDKPIAVFAGHQCTQMPYLGGCCCDRVIEAIPPVGVWGCEFASMPLATRTAGDTFRFLASRDGTTVNVNGTAVATLARGQIHERSVTGAAHITANEPILVAQYSNSSAADNVVSDPFMMLVPPTWQYLSAYTVATPMSGFTNHHLNLVAPTASTGGLLLDGGALPGGSWTVIGTSGYSGREVTVASGTHTVTGPAPFAVWSYGFGSYDSYGYPGGMFFPEPEVRLTMTASAKYVPPGGVLTYTVYAVTFGSATPLNVQVWDTLPNGVAFTSATSGGAWDGVKVVWSLAALTPGITETLSVTVQVSATINGALIGPVDAMTTHDNRPACRPDLASPPLLVWVARPEPVLQAGLVPDPVTCDRRELTFRASWSNAGEATALVLTITDTLPAGVAWRAPSVATWCQPDWLGAPGVVSLAHATGAAGPWIAGEPADGTPGPLVLRWVVDRVAPHASGQLSFNASVSATLPDGAVIRHGLSATRFDSATPVVSPTVSVTVRQPALVVTLTAAPPAVTAGDLVTWTLLVRSTGADTAWNVTAWDTVPAGIAFGTADSGGTFDGTLVRWSLPTLPPGASAQVRFTVTATTTGPALPPGFAAAGWTDCAATGWKAAVGGPVTVPVAHGVPVLRKELTTPPPIVPGIEIEYRISWSNAGAATLAGLAFLDSLPAGTTWRGPTLVAEPVNDWLGAPAVGAVEHAPAVAGPWTPGEPADGTPPPLWLRWAVDRVAPHASGALTYHVTISSTLPVGAAIVNTVGATAWWGAGPVTTTHTVILSLPELALTKTPSAAAVAVGAPLTYGVLVRNTGNDTAWSITVRDTLPPGTIYAGCAGGATCGWDGTRVTWLLDPLIAGGATQLSVSVVVNGLLSCSNWAEADYAAVSGASMPVATSAPVCVGLVQPVLSVTLLADRAVVTSGEPLVWRVIVHNAGDDTATAVAVTTNWSAGLTPWSATPAGVPAATSITWGPLLLPPGVGATLYLSLESPPTDCDGAVWDALAQLDAANSAGDPLPSLLTLTVPVRVVNASVRLALAPSATSVQAGARLTFTLSWSNPCADTAWSVAVTDTLPAGLVYLSCTAPAGGGCGPAGGLLQWSWPGGAIPPGASGTVTFTVSATGPGPTIALPPPFAAWENGAGFPLFANGGAALITIREPRLTVDKTGPPTISGRERVTYHIRIRNLGDDTAIGLRVVDSLPAPMIATAARPPWSGLTSGPQGGTIVTWTVTTLGIGEDLLIELTAAAGDEEQDGEITNLAGVAGRTPLGLAAGAPPARTTATLSPVLVLRVYPTPYAPDEAVRGALKFTGLPTNSIVHVWTLAGVEVRALSAGRRHRVEWDGLNAAGGPCAAGTYLYGIEIPEPAGGTRWLKGKFGLVR